MAAQYMQENYQVPDINNLERESKATNKKKNAGSEQTAWLAPSTGSRQAQSGCLGISILALPSYKKLVKKLSDPKRKRKQESKHSD